MSTKKIIGKAPKGLLLCESVMVGDTFYLSGSIGFDHKTGKLVQGGVAAETRKAIENLRMTLQKAEMDFTNIVRVTVCLKTMNDFQLFNDVYATYFPKDAPVRETSPADGLAFDARVELSSIAVKS